MTGYAPEEAIGETPHILFSGEMDEAYYESLWETIQAGEVWEEEIVDERKDGELYHALQTIAPVPDDDGTVERFVAIQTDITEQKFLERRRRQYQQAIENSVELIAAVDDDENYLFANETYREYHDLGETAVQGQSLAEVLGAEEYAAVRPHVEAVRNGETVRRETTRIHPTLGRRVLDVLYYPLRDDEGAIQGIIASMRDVTDHKEESRQLETLIGHLPGIVYRCHNTPDWPMTFVGGQCEAITGYSAEQLESDALSWGDDIVHPDARERVFDEVQAAVARDEPFEVTYRIRTADGETRWVWEQGQRVKPYTGDESMLEGIIMDVTERKAQETEIRQKSRTIDEAPIGIVITDPTLEDNPMTYVNDEFAAMTGYDRSAALGRNCRFLQGENTDPDTVARIRRSIDAEEPVSAVLRNYRADGTEFWNNLEIAPVRDDDGEVINYIGFQQDITERIERQRQLRKIDRVLRHNLNNDLNVVQGMAELIRSEVGSPLVEYADRIIETSDSLLETMDKERRITSLLSEEPQPTTVALLPTLETVVERYREAYPAATVELNAPEDVTVRATTQLETALAELLDNALEHNDSDAPTAAVSVTTGPDAVTVEISDDGPGIPEMEAAIVTDGEVETPLSHGKGMGLWLVQLIVRRSGGTLEFVDGETAGSTVAITLARAGS
jgi:PAS domain S-box-containing protein